MVGGVSGGDCGGVGDAGVGGSGDAGGCGHSDFDRVVRIFIKIV